MRIFCEDPLPETPHAGWCDRCHIRIANGEYQPQFRIGKKKFHENCFRAEMRERLASQKVRADQRRAIA